MGVRRSTAPEDHSSKLVEPTSRERKGNRTRPLKLGEGVETGWRAPLVGESTVRLSSKGESDRITQRLAVQIRPPCLGSRTHHHCRNAVAFACFQNLLFPAICKNGFVHVGLCFTTNSTPRHFRINDLFPGIRDCALTLSRSDADLPI